MASYVYKYTMESEIISKIQSGNTAAFGSLYDKYIKKIYDFIYYKTMHKETAEDLTSQVFIKALKKIDTFNEQKGTFQAWLYQIARNTVIDHYRQQKTMVDIEDVWGLADKSNMEIDVANKHLLEQVEVALAGFTTEQREIVILRVWQGLSYKEIAEVIGKSENSCKVTFSRTIKKLKNSGDFLAVLLFFINIVK